MRKEIIIGGAAGVVLYLALAGYVNAGALIALGMMGGILFLLYSNLPLTRKFDVVTKSGKGEASITFADIGGQESAKRELLEALEFVNDAQRAHRLGIRPLRGILLTGPPGTGKTLLAKAAATYMDSAFIAASGSEFVEVYAGMGAKHIRELFRKARKLALQREKRSCVIFIDEIEVLGGKRGQHTSHLEYDQTLNQLLVEMDGIGNSDGVRILVIGATNRQDLLDPALLRPGRFDRIVRVDLPDKSGRLSILKLHTKDKPLDEDVDIDSIAAETFGFSGAHLESLANEAAILAMREGCERICARHFKEAMDKVIMGEKLDRKPSMEELKRIASHESGHAIVSETLRPGSVSTLTVTSRGNALGYMRQARDEDIYLYTRSYLEDEIAILLGGVQAEEIAFGSRSTGALGDLEQAVSVARRMVSCGMSDLGIISVKDAPRTLFHQAVTDIIRAQEKRVHELLTAKRSVLARVADMLFREERLSGDTLRKVLAEGKACNDLSA